MCCSDRGREGKRQLLVSSPQLETGRTVCAACFQECPCSACRWRWFPRWLRTCHHHPSAADLRRLPAGPRCWIVGSSFSCRVVPGLRLGCCFWDLCLTSVLPVSKDTTFPLTRISECWLLDAPQWNLFPRRVWQF